SIYSQYRTIANWGGRDVAEPKATEQCAEPRAEYELRLDARRRLAALEEKRQRLTGNTRIAAVLLVLALGYPILATGQFGVGWLALPVVLFLIVSIIHDRVTRAWQRAARAVAFYEKGLARLDNHWAGQGQSGDRFLDPSHPYALDLDLFGVGSLF